MQDRPRCLGRFRQGSPHWWFCYLLECQPAAASAGRTGLFGRADLLALDAGDRFSDSRSLFSHSYYIAHRAGSRQRIPGLLTGLQGKLVADVTTMLYS